MCAGQLNGVDEGGCSGVCLGMEQPAWRGARLASKEDKGTGTHILPDAPSSSMHPSTHPLPLLPLPLAPAYTKGAPLVVGLIKGVGGWGLRIKRYLLIK